MTKYEALVDIPPSVKKGDIVELKDAPIPEFAKKLKLVGNEVEAEPEGSDKTVITNPDRTALKARATELKIVFADNIPTAKLVELIQEAEAAAE